MSRLKIFITGIGLLSSLVGNAQQKDIAATAFFKRTTGWIASDGGLTVALSDGRTLWLMGDSHINDYDTATGTIPCLFQVRNAALLQPAGDWDPGHTKTLIGTGPGIKSFFKRTADNNYWFWPGAGIQLKDTIYVYCGELKKTGPGTFGFAGTGKDMWAKMKFPEMVVTGYASLQDFKDINFGVGFIKDEHNGYVYAYGQRGIPQTIENNIYVARFPAARPNEPWECWDGATWNKDMGRAAPIGKAFVTPHVSKVKNKYLLLSSALSVACDQGKEIYASTSDHPAGPFTERRLIYTIDDTLQGHYPFFYTVVAHPQFINRNGLLITYCINGYAPCMEACPNGRADPDHYRPKGIRIPLKRIDL